MPITVETCLVTYANPGRLHTLLSSVSDVPDIIIEDYSTDALSQEIQHIAQQFGAQHTRRPTWGGLQGAGQYMMERSTADWVLYWTDDAAPTPGSIAALRDWCRLVPSHVGALQWPYWNVPDLVERFPGLIPPNGMFDPGFASRLPLIPFNPHWFGPAFYLNVNGAGFALRRAAWESVGGFSPQTWCLDEDISVRLWLSGNWTVMTVPGPPIIHHGGLSTPDQHAHGHTNNRAATIDGWLDAWRRSKEDVGAECRRAMASWQAKTGYLAR